MNNLKQHSASVLCMVLAFVLLGCTAQQKISRLTDIKKEKAPFLMEQLLDNQLQFEWFSAKVGTKVKLQGKTTKFKSNIRIRKDSAIWVSMSPGVGIEAARVLITTDSVKFINKINKTYFFASISELNERLNTDLDYKILEDFIAGRAVGFDPEEKYKATIDTTARYLLTSKNPRKVRRAVEMEGDPSDEDTTLGITVDENRLQRAMGNLAEDDLFIFQYWLNAENYRLEEIRINDLRLNGVIEINYSEFEALEDGQQFPHKSSMYVTDKVQSIEIDFEFSKVKLNKPASFPFRISDKYERID